ncbi:hypothetical protein [Acidovorax sp. NCPPB 3576]|uniref:hypothetical protein n=1 Tax=Acidovorax sp. NCPPB 3576 TaxID=2940488 RepID=UPI00234AC2A8|nr:hypothetical protein [Acidovorax sp. NCPPB 3576]WCM90082.1 hypothetical protein M5C98_08735 [Acidovorax sp. NCPPB 3576]
MEQILKGLEMHEKHAQETVFGVADGATYTAELCLSKAGHYYFMQIQVDGHNLPVTESHWPTRDQAMVALTEYASGARRLDDPPVVGILAKD